jgi:pimeloyl-ACP methyl ester carboxylesterase
MNQAIIIVGGYNSFWPVYLGLARHLEGLSGLQAVGVPIMPWHWWSARQSEDATNILQNLSETVIWARRRFQAEQFILVGHSAGGVLARLYLCDEPVWGQIYAGVEHVRAVITLGSPHCGDRGTETGWYATDQANRLAPGTPYDSILYRAVAGRFIRGRQAGSYRERRAFRFYEFFGSRGDVWGDGMVPVSCAGLDGADATILPRVVHSRKLGRGWYGGSRDIIRRWWPQELNDAG